MAEKDVRTLASPDYFKRGSLVILLSVILGFAADYLFNLTLSNTLPAHEYGDYKVAYAFAAVASVLVLLGGDRIAPRVLAPSLSRGDNHEVWTFLQFYLKVAVTLSVIVIIATITASIAHIGPTDMEQHHPLLFMSLVIPLIAIGAMLSRILQSARLLALSNLPWRIALPLMKIVMLLLLTLLLTRIKLWHVIAVGALSVSLIIVWQWSKIRQHGLIRLERREENFDGPALLRLSIPMMLAMLVALALNQVDLFMLEIFGEEHEVGFFAAAATTVHILPVAQVTIAGLFLPLIGPALEQGGHAAHILFRQGQRLITYTVILLFACILVAGKWLLTLFGENFIQAQNALIYLAMAYALWAIAAFSSTWLQYTRRGAQVVYIGIITLSIDALCNLWLIPIYGVDGAAMATLIAMIITSVLTGLLYIRHLKPHLIAAREGL